jgi:hypothetical protein
MFAALMIGPTRNHRTLALQLGRRRRRLSFNDPPPGNMNRHSGRAAASAEEFFREVCLLRNQK